MVGAPLVDAAHVVGRADAGAEDRARASIDAGGKSLAPIRVVFDRHRALLKEAVAQGDLEPVQEDSRPPSEALGGDARDVESRGGVLAVHAVARAPVAEPCLLVVMQVAGVRVERVSARERDQVKSVRLGGRFRPGPWPGWCRCCRLVIRVKSDRLWPCLCGDVSGLAARCRSGARVLA